MRSKSFQRNLFIGVGGIFILFAACFSVYQYNREREYKIDIMQSRMQTYNYEMVQTLGDSTISRNAVVSYVAKHNLEGIRVTIIDLKGKVLVDSKQADVNKMKNHLHREEVQQALRKGNGYDIMRTSESTNETYFYSATRIGNQIIRTAIPYSTQLSQSLQADDSFLIFAVVLTVLLGIILYYNTSRISRHIGYLRQFAKDAENGNELDHELERRLPDDELGEISHTIITLYWKLRHSEEEKTRIKHQLTQNAAHELKTPAASIHGYLESIIDNPDMPADKRQHFLERCYAQSERMNKLLLDMAMLTKLDKDKEPRNDDNGLIDVKIIIINVLEDTAMQLKEKGIEPELHLPEKVYIHSSMGHDDGASAIYSLFRNLVDNSIAYAAGATKIKITCVDTDPQFIFSYSDNGPGVEPEHLPHIFERFYRVDKGRSRKLGGTGLGLAIVKNVITSHGGSVSAELTPGGGLTINFTLKH